MNALLVALASLLGLTHPTQTCTSSVFGYSGDKWAGGDALYYGRPVNDTDLGIAHRRLPLGSLVIVRVHRTNRVAFARVIDRGPYGARYEGRWVLKKRRQDPGRWRGCADFTPALARRTGHDGWERITIYEHVEDTFAKTETRLEARILCELGEGGTEQVCSPPYREPERTCTPTTPGAQPQRPRACWPTLTSH